MQDYGFSNESGLSDFSRPISLLKSWEHGPLPGIFWFVERFSRANVRFEIAYGDKELYIEGHWWFDDSEHEFGMWEILHAAESYDRRLSGSSWVNSVEFMNKTISDMAESLEENIDLFINPRFENIDRALELRGKRLRYDQEKQRLRDLSRARVAAAEAFRLKDYRQVINLLAPFDKILSEADRKKIHLSEKYAKSI